MSRRLVYVTNRVNNSRIRKTTNDRGDEVWVIPSYTTPDNCIMNGGLYPADEIEKSYFTLEGTPAPLSHPVDAEGNYLSANSPDGVIYYQCGIFNKNVKRVKDAKYGHRIYVEKHLHVETAKQTERGRRVLDAIEKNEPIHTSTGVILDVIEEQGKHNGKEYQWRAKDMVFDHDCILLDEQGAATPDDGVGLFVNSNLLRNVNIDGRSMAVNHVVANEPQEEMTPSLRDQIKSIFNELFINRREVGTNQEKGNDMTIEEIIEAALTEAEIDFADMTAEQRLAAYVELQQVDADEADQEANDQPQGEQVGNEALAKIVADAVADAMQANQANSEKAERDALAEKLKGNSSISRETQDKMQINELRELAQSLNRKPAVNFAGGKPAEDSLLSGYDKGDL